MKKFLLAFVAVATLAASGDVAHAATPYPTYSDVCNSTTQTITTPRNSETQLYEVNNTKIIVSFKSPTAVRGTGNCIIALDGQRNAGLVVYGDYNYVQAQNTRVTFVGNNNFVDSQGSNDVKCNGDNQPYVNYLHLGKRDTQTACTLV